MSIHKHAFLIDGRYTEVGPFESAHGASIFLHRQNPNAKKIEGTPLRPPEYVAPVKEDKTPSKPEPKDPAQLPAAPPADAPTPEVANEPVASSDGADQS